MREISRPATTSEIVETLRYALKFGETGKPLTKGYRDDAGLMAKWLVQHLMRSNFQVSRRVSEPGPTPGRCGKPHAP